MKRFYCSFTAYMKVFVNLSHLDQNRQKCNLQPPPLDSFCPSSPPVITTSPHPSQTRLFQSHVKQNYLKYIKTFTYYSQEITRKFRKSFYLIAGWHVAFKTLQQLRICDHNFRWTRWRI